MRVWTLGKVWEDLSLEVTAGDLGGVKEMTDRKMRRLISLY